MSLPTGPELGDLADQSEAPYLDAVVAYVAREPGRLHIPGHKGAGGDPGLIEAEGYETIWRAYDLPADR